MIFRLLFIGCLLSMIGCNKSTIQISEPECIECLNGGTCVDNVCDCPEPFFGEKCNYVREDATPILDRLIIRGYKTGSWDPNGNPDLCVKVWQDNSNVWTSKVYENWSPDQPLELSVEHRMEYANGLVYIDLVDVDTVGGTAIEEFIQTLDFDLNLPPPYWTGVPHPSELTYMHLNNETTVYVSYE